MNLDNAKAIAKEFLEKVEGLKLVGYADSGGVATDGYGNTHGAVIGQKIDIVKAQVDLLYNINIAASELINVCSRDALNNLHDHECAALISFVFNAGAGNWQIWKDIKTNNIDNVPTQLARFDHAKVDGKLVEVEGLKNRRIAEITLWDTADINTASTIVGSVEIAPNNLYVCPKPDPVRQQKADNGFKVAATVSAATLPVLATKLSSFEIALPYIVGFCIGCVFCLVLGAIFYYIELKKPKPVKTIYIDKTPDWIKNMPVSQAFTDALTKLTAAYQAEVDAAGAAAAAAATAAADADAVAAIEAATPQPAQPANPPV